MQERGTRCVLLCIPCCNLTFWRSTEQIPPLGKTFVVALSKFSRTRQNATFQLGNAFARKVEYHFKLLSRNQQRHRLLYQSILDMAKTRAKGPVKAEKEEVEAAKITAPKVQLGPESSNPPQLFILPKDISKDARIVTLENPRYGTDSRYLVCQERGFYEFTEVAALKTTSRSWLLSSQDSTLIEEEETQKQDADTNGTDLRKGYVTKDANLYIATPIDPMFLLLPALAPQQTSKGSEPTKKLFLSGEDYFEKINSTSSQFGPFARTESIRGLLEKRMAAVCDTVDAGDETMYRLSEEKLVAELLGKAKKMSEKGLPGSMEERLIRKALEAPVLSIMREESSMHELAKEEDGRAADSGIATPVTDSMDSQTTESSTVTAASSFSEASTAATSLSEDSITTIKPTPMLPTISAPEGVADLLRLRTAFFFICSSYLAPHLSEVLEKFLASSISSIDFTPLDTHLAHLAKLRQDAVAARSLGDYSRKRNMYDEDEDGETRAEKKRKKDEEEKRKKAGESRGVKNLKKANVSGMRKMSDFFKKKT